MFRMSEENGNKDNQSTSSPLLWFVVPLIVAGAFMALMHTAVGRVYVIPSASMEPTLHGCPGCTNDRVYAEKVSYWGDGDPEQNDVVVFETPESWQMQQAPERGRAESLAHGVLSAIGVVPPDTNFYVKRVIATEGQTVQCLPGDPGVMVDGKPADEPFGESNISPPPGVEESETCRGPYFGPVTVPEGRLWVMGDNRTNSLDSRFHQDDHQGTIDKNSVAGKVVAIVGPPSRWTTDV